MSAAEMERVLRDVDVRTSTIEQILPTLATKKDLNRFATKEDLKRFATKDHLKRFATKDDLAQAVTMLRAEMAESRRYALVLHEDVKADIRMLAEHLAGVLERLDRTR